VLLHLEPGLRVPVEPDEVFLLEADGDETRALTGGIPVSGPPPAWDLGERNGSERRREEREPVPAALPEAVAGLEALLPTELPPLW
jgi:hypothetical protein